MTLKLRSELEKGKLKNVLAYCKLNTGSLRKLNAPTHGQQVKRIKKLSIPDFSQSTWFGWAVRKGLLLYEK